MSDWLDNFQMMGVKLNEGEKSLMRFAINKERERILAILDKHCVTTTSGGGGIECWSCGNQDYDEHLIALIKGENK
jgi:hypothetical protein